MALKSYTQLVTELEQPVHTTGTFMGVRFVPESVDMLHNLITFNGIENPIDLEELHSTLIFSRNDISKEDTAQPRVNLNARCKMIGYHVFQKEGGDPVLVVKLESPYLRDRHQEIMDGTLATYDFPEYIPHVTLSYNFTGDIGELLSLPKTPLVIDHEYTAEIDLDWT